MAGVEEYWSKISISISYKAWNGGLTKKKKKHGLVVFLVVYAKVEGLLVFDTIDAFKSFLVIYCFYEVYELYLYSDLNMGFDKVHSDTCFLCFYLPYCSLWFYYHSVQTLYRQKKKKFQNTEKEKFLMKLSPRA